MVPSVPPPVQCPASGPDLWVGGDSQRQCSCWSWCTASSWTLRCRWVRTSPCAASRSERRGGRGKETSSAPDGATCGPALTPRLPATEAASHQNAPPCGGNPYVNGQVMLLETWPADAWLDESVSAATVLAKEFGCCGPQLIPPWQPCPGGWVEEGSNATLGANTHCSQVNQSYLVLQESVNCRSCSTGLYYWARLNLVALVLLIKLWLATMSP